MGVPTSEAVTANTTAAAITMPTFPELDSVDRSVNARLRLTVSNAGSTVVYVTNTGENNATPWAIPAGDSREYDFIVTADSALALYSSSGAACRVYARLVSA